MLDVAQTDEVRVLLMTIFLFFFNFLVCKALFIVSRVQFPRNRAKLTTKVTNIAIVCSYV